LKKEPDGYSVSVDVYNLGLTAGWVFVDLVLWYVEGSVERRSSGTVQHASNLFLPGARPGGIAAMITTPESKVSVPGGQRLTHVYAVAYDPIFDKLDAFASTLLRATTPNFQSNAARQSRQVGCLNVFYAEKGYAFGLKWIHRVPGHLSPAPDNDTGAPVDLCVIKASGVTDRIAIGTSFFPEIIADVRLAIDRITPLGVLWSWPLLVSQNPLCDPNCTPGNDKEWVGVSPLTLMDAGMEIDGKHDGNGLILDIPDLRFETPWSPGAEQIVSLRCLLR
jgi:hypothetical protein